MKSLRKLLAASVLTCVLSVCAFAGDMHTGYTDTGDTQTTVTGDMHTGVAATTTGDMGTPVTSSTDPVTGIALSLVQSVLALF